MLSRCDYSPVTKTIMSLIDDEKNNRQKLSPPGPRKKFRGGSHVNKLFDEIKINIKVKKHQMSQLRECWLSKQFTPKGAYGQNGDKLKRLPVQSKHINLLSSTMDLFSELFTKFQLTQLCSFCSAVIS